MLILMIDKKTSLENKEEKEVNEICRQNSYDTLLRGNVLTVLINSTISKFVKT